MSLQFKFVKFQDPLCDEIKILYETSFPENERQPFSALFSDFDGGEELLAVLDGEFLAGIAVLLSYEDITHIMYLAVPEAIRSRGYGSCILKYIRERYAGQRIIADLECPKENSPNEGQREKRTAFYQKNGYCFTDIAYRWEGEDYRIMSNGGNVTFEEFRRFWYHFFSNKPK